MTRYSILILSAFSIIATPAYAQTASNEMLSSGLMNKPATVDHLDGAPVRGAFDPKPSVPLADVGAHEESAGRATEQVAAEPAEKSTRNAFEISYSDAEEAVGAALNQKGIGDKISVTIVGRKNAPIFASDKPVTIEVKGLQIEKRDNRWSASLLFVAAGEVVSALPSTGHFDEMVELPVLKREIRTGDIISEADIEIRDFSMAHTRTDTVTDISALVGKSPLHNISPSRPLREHEVASPAIIKKNNVVDMHYSSPGMEITTVGQALDDGAKGDVINIRNMASKKIVRAIIADNKTVNIIAPGMETSQLTGAGDATN